MRNVLLTSMVILGLSGPVFSAPEADSDLGLLKCPSSDKIVDALKGIESDGSFNRIVTEVALKALGKDKRNIEGHYTGNGLSVSLGGKLELISSEKSVTMRTCKYGIGVEKPVFVLFIKS